MLACGTPWLLCPCCSTIPPEVLSIDAFCSVCFYISRVKVFKSHVFILRNPSEETEVGPLQRHHPESSTSQQDHSGCSHQSPVQVSFTPVHLRHWYVCCPEHRCIIYSRLSLITAGREFLCVFFGAEAETVNHVSQGPEVCWPEPDVHEKPVAAVRSQSVPDWWERRAWGEDCRGSDRQLPVCLRCEYNSERSSTHLPLSH